MSETPPIKKQKRTRLSLHEKANAARLLKNGTDAADVMKKFNVSRRTVSNLKASTDNLLRRADNCSISLELKTFRSARIPELDSKVVQFVDYARCAKLSLTVTDIQQYALLVRDELLRAEEGSSTALRSSLSHFTASKGWIDNFVRRHGVRSVLSQGESVSPYTEAGIKELAILHCQLRTFAPKFIYKVEETALFFKLLPRATYILKSEGGKPSLFDAQAMRASDRVTMYLCTNIDGSDKLPMTMIGRDRHPSCFRLAPPPIPYLWQTDAWSDAATMRSWFHEVFLSHVRAITTNPVALVMDRTLPAVGELKDGSGQVSVITLPTACTIPASLAETPISDLWRTVYRRSLLSAYANDIDSRMHRRDLNKELRSDMLGLAEGHDPHLLDVAELSRESWVSIPNSAIAQWWMKSYILPVEVTSHLYTSYGNKPGLSKDQCIRDVKNLFTIIKKSLKAMDPLNGALFDVTEEHIVQWMAIEENRDVAFVLVQDAIERSRLPTNETQPPDGNTAVSEGAHSQKSNSNPFSEHRHFSSHLSDQNETGKSVSNNDDLNLRCFRTRTATAKELSLPEVHASFSTLLNFAFDCNMPEVMSHLRTAKQLMIDKIALESCSSHDRKNMRRDTPIISNTVADDDGTEDNRLFNSNSGAWEKASREMTNDGDTSDRPRDVNMGGVSPISGNVAVSNEDSSKVHEDCEGNSSMVEGKSLLRSTEEANNIDITDQTRRNESENVVDANSANRAIKSDELEQSSGKKDAVSTRTESVMLPNDAEEGFEKKEVVFEASRPLDKTKAIGCKRQ